MPGNAGQKEYKVERGNLLTICISLEFNMSYWGVLEIFTFVQFYERNEPHYI